MNINPFRVVGLDGLEPSTSRLSGVRSSHLSYKPFLFRFTHLVSILSIHSCRGLKFQLIAVLPRSWVRQLGAGGDDGIRTHDPLLAGQVLSQLSYTPVSGFACLFKDLFLILKN